MKRMHYAWWVCIGCALLLFVTSGLSINAFTIYQPYIMRQNGFTNAQSSALITIRSLTSLLAMLAAERYYRRLSLRVGMAAAGVLVAAGFGLFGLAGSYAVYCVAAALVGLGYGVGTMIPIAIVLERWFVKERTLAIGACSAVTGLSTLGIPSLLTAVIEHAGLRASFLLETAAMLLLVAMSFLLIRSNPAQMGLSPFGGEEGADGKTVRRAGAGIEARDWLLLVPMLLLLGAMTNVGYSHLAVHMAAMGYPPQIVAMGITVSGVGLMVGKIAFGWIAGRIGTYRCDWLFGVLLLAGILLCCLPVFHPAFLYSALLLYGSGLSLTTVGLTAWAGDWGGEGQYDTTVERFQIGYSGGTLLFSTLPGILADRAGGSYRPAYLFFLLCAVFVLLTAQHLYRKKRAA